MCRYNPTSPDILLCLGNFVPPQGERKSLQQYHTFKYHLFCEPAPLFPNQSVNIPKNVLGICPTHRPRLQVCLPPASGGWWSTSRKSTTRVSPSDNWAASGSLRQGWQFDNHTVAVPFQNKVWNLKYISYVRYLGASSSSSALTQPRLRRQRFSPGACRTIWITWRRLEMCRKEDRRTFKQLENTLSFCQEPNILLDPVTATISPGCVGHLRKKQRGSRPWILIWSR